MPMQQPVVVLTGAAGFLGHALIRELIQARQQGNLPISRLVLLDQVAVETEQYDSPVPLIPVRADIRDKERMGQCLRGADVVIHAASVVDWGNKPSRLLEEVNLGGTRNVLTACQENDVTALIYTSTMDVVYSGRAIRDGDESLPYPATHMDAYARSKAGAEQLVLAANGRNGLRTSVLRPCGMYGPDDPYHIAETLKAVQSGLLRWRIGDGRARFQHVYVGNVAAAHVQLLQAMIRGNPQVNGEVYLVTDDPPENFFDFLDPLFRGSGFPFPGRRPYLPYRFMLGVARMAEIITRCLSPLIPITSPVTRSSIRMLCEDLTFKTDKASRHFGYRPRYSKADAFDATLAWLKAGL